MITEYKIDKSDKLDDAIRDYLQNLEESPEIRLIHKDLDFPEFLQNKILVSRSIRKGFPFSLFEEIKSLIPFSETDWAKLFNISHKSLQRYKNEKDFYFKPIHTEKIIEIAEVAILGNEIFDSSKKFEKWLNTPSLALGNLPPLDLLMDSYGKELVMAELNRIDHGIFV
ncbi:type II RES/Xre toxin-antitoxin system antitoxin [Salegentibacter maritimus]|uniref:type II RES/Xre toxin-antitoxin system antitoxin n=1 Tax=Salegentibacter maritimus TaxID=2794347 RepID=UPI0018E3FC14|nr:antitoxin Xre/MbcA/ParS toxin-binding domain-containing protein [Salegentibacter maritimus]MBI6116353.1 DUF2384 domain-containing protein [Salegentibacter maritimus]